MLEIIACSLPFVVPTLTLSILDFVQPQNVTSHANQVDPLTPAYFFAFVGALAVAFALLTPLSPKRGRRQNDVARLFYDAAFLFLASNVRLKVDRSPGLYVGCFCAYLVVYTGAFEICKRRNVVIVPNINCSSALALLAALVALCPLAANFLFAAWRVSVDFFVVYASVFFSAFAIGVFMIWSAPSFHLHHRLTSLLAAHACVFATDVSIVSQAMFLAVYVHGMSVFGAEKAFASV